MLRLLLYMEQSIVTIVEATGQDVPGIIKVQEATWLATYVNSTYGVTAEDIKAKSFLNPNRVARWVKSVEEDIDQKTWVAKNKVGEVVGFLVALKKSSLHKIGALYVLPLHQDAGVGKRLVERALVWLGSEKDIILDVVTYNTKAIAFYTKCGFVLVGETPMTDLSKLPSGKLMPEVRMIKKYH